MSTPIPPTPEAQPLKSTQGPWLVDTSHGAIEIVDVSGANVIGLAHEMSDAVLFASAPEMLDALIAIHETLSHVEDSPVKDEIENFISMALEKIHAEADV